MEKDVNPSNIKLLSLFWVYLSSINRTRIIWSTLESHFVLINIYIYITFLPYDARFGNIGKLSFGVEQQKPMKMR